MEEIVLKANTVLISMFFIAGLACTTDFRGGDGESDTSDGTEDTAVETETDGPDLLADPDMTGDTDAPDALDDPDLVPDVPEDRTDCIPAVPFAASCERASAHPCPGGALPGLECNWLFEELNGPRLPDSMNFTTRDQSDVCASFCQCGGFLTLEVGNSAHAITGPVKTAPSVMFYPPVGGDFVSLEVTLVEAFSTDTPGQSAGLYVLQDADSLFTAAIVQEADAKYLVVETWENNNTLTPDRSERIEIPDQLQHLHTIQVNESGRNTWDIVTTGITLPMGFNDGLVGNEAGIFVGNSVTTSGAIHPTPAWFDYICVDSDTY